MIINLGIVSVEIVNDGAGSLFMFTLNGVCIKEYWGYDRYSKLRYDIKRLKNGDDISL